jgi:hypothetical protein
VRGLAVSDRHPYLFSGDLLTVILRNMHRVLVNCIEKDLY